ncbi:ABC transporter substrate-binding protein [Halosquirtibacter laminarini]|uniref:ABC transporter substrate-binding protein n=1 Tax=Halosquirtibacter laminarini TaxID=3374600 RepID=A0AC61NJ37_9BACT|nr:ABC transporter substrate-binding protein [Prolixibacteraceae bacterium]
MYKFFSFLAIVLLLVGCVPKSKTKEDHTKHNRFAKGFLIDYEKEVLEITSPWQGANIHLSYTKKNTSNIRKEGVMSIALPKQMKRIVSFSTTHIGFLRELGILDHLVGISGANYVNDPALLERIKNGDLQDVGYDNTLNEELILSLKPDVILAYGVGSEVMDLYERFQKFHIPVVVIGEYNELHPLGKLEWIKVFGFLFDKQDLADAIFNKKEIAYTKLVEQVKSSNLKKPSVLTGFPYKDAWWLAGGRTLLAQLIRDAGANYLWDDKKVNKAFVVSFEEVYLKSNKADFWIDCGVMSSKKQIVESDPRFQKFRPFKENHIYNNNLRMSPDGGNDYWESGVVNPELVLKDMIAIFHPELLPEHLFYFYQKIN